LDASLHDDVHAEGVVMERSMQPAAQACSVVLVGSEHDDTH
jgi:hypothetical protein